MTGRSSSRCLMVSIMKSVASAERSMGVNHKNIRNPKLIDLYRVKPICIICDGAKIKGDVIMTKHPVGAYLGDYTHVFYVDGLKKGVEITNTKYICRLRDCHGIYLKLVFIFNILVLRKDYFYMVGFLK